MRNTRRQQILFTAAAAMMAVSLIYTPLARVSAGGAAQQANTNRPVIRVVRPGATPTPSPTPAAQGNSNRRVIRIGGGAARVGGNSNSNTNANANANTNADTNADTNSGGPVRRRDPTGPVIRREVNSNRGVIRIGNANNGGSADPDSPAASNSNRRTGREGGGIVIGRRDRTGANANSPSTDTGGSVGPLVGGGGRVGARVSLSPKVDAELSRLNRMTAVPLASFVVPQRAQGMAQVVLFNDKDLFGVYECDKSQGKDDLALEETGEHLVVSFRCANSRNAMDRGARRGSNRLAVAFRKDQIKGTFTARGAGMTYGPVGTGALRKTSAFKLPASNVPDGVSRDEFELANCLAAFRRYRDEPAMRYFRVRFAARVYRCEVDRSRANYEMRRSGLFAGLASRDDLPTVSADSALADFRLRSTRLAQNYDPDYKGTRERKTFYEKAVSLTDNPDAPVPNYVFPGEPDSYDFVFALNGKPGFSKVAVQLAYSQTLPPLKGSACDGWETPAGFVRQTVHTPTYEPAPADAGLRSNGKGQPQLGSVRVKPAFITDGLVFVPKATVFARVVPLGGKGAARCMGGPSPWVKIAVDNPRAAHAAEQERLKKKKEAHDKFLAERGKVAGNDPASLRAHSPIKVSVVSYIPPLKVDNLLVAYNLSELEWRGPTGFDLSPVYGWPERKWPKECAYDADELLVAATAYKELPDDLLEWIIYVFDQASIFYAQWQTIIVDTFSFLVSGGECNGKNEPAACAPVRTGLRTGLRYALSAAGLPPTIPNVAALLDQANSRVAMEAVDFALSQFPGGDIGGLAKDALREPLIQQTRELLSQWSQTLRCAYPVPPGRTPQERHANAVAMGYEGVKGNGCGEIKGDLNPYEFGLRNEAVRDRPGVLYLRIERNASPGALHFSKRQRIEIKDASKFYLPADIFIDVDNIPPGGLVAPVVLNPDIASASANLNKFGVTQGSVDTGCHTADGLSTCVDEGLQRSLWLNAWGKNLPFKLGIRTEYKWAEVAPFGVEESPVVRVDWDGLGLGLREQHNTYGELVTLAACPGYKYEMMPGPPREIIVGTVNNWHQK